VLLLAGRTEEALAVHARAIAGAEAALGPAHPTTARRILARGAVHERREDYAAALRDYAHALGVWERALGEHPRLIWALTCVGRVLRRLGEPERAENYYARALAIAEAAHGPDDPEAAYACVELAGVVAETGRAAEARGLYARALAGLLVERDPPVLAWPLIEIGEALCTEEPARAAAALEQARRVQISSDERARADLALARALWSLGERARARELAAAAAVGPTEVAARAWLAERL
jgi:tetratricopeptide (TPR) repeat protein